MATQLSFTERVPVAWSRDGRASSPSAAPIALILTCLTLVLTHFASFWAGRMVEQRTQLGYLVAAAPALEDLTAATRFQDSVSMQFVIQMERMKHKRSAPGR